MVMECRREMSASSGPSVQVYWLTVIDDTSTPLCRLIVIPYSVASGGAQRRLAPAPQPSSTFNQLFSKHARPNKLEGFVTVASSKKLRKEERLVSRGRGRSDQVANPIVRKRRGSGEEPKGVGALYECAVAVSVINRLSNE
ncbi:hypothetical protein CBL_13318 [Carabus blaptoides fortunei]